MKMFDSLSFKLSGAVAAFAMTATSANNRKKRQPKTALSGVEVKGKSRAELLAIPAVQAEITQAKSQLAHYKQVLLNEYGPNTKLCAFAVVGIGVERVVWDVV